ncbi:MAG: hypothetical protein MHMPM18_000074 [Marteilia pararefringens]
MPATFDANSLAQLSRDFVQICRQNLSKLSGDDDRQQVEAHNCTLIVLSSKTNHLCFDSFLNLNSVNSKNPEKAEALKLEGNACLKEKKFASAIHKYTEAIQYDNQNSALYYNRGLVLHSQAKLDDALVDLKQALRLNPTYAKAHYKISQVYEQKAQYDEAIESAKAAVDCDASNKLFADHLASVEDKKERLVSGKGATGSDAPLDPDMLANMQNMLGNLTNASGGEGGSGGIDLSKIGQYAEKFMKDPAYQKLAADMLSKPEFQEMSKNLFNGKNQ